MRKIVKSVVNLGLTGMALCLFMAGCSSDDSVFQTPTDPTGPTDPTDPGDPVAEVATIMFTEGGADDDKFTAEAKGEVGTKVPGRVIFTSTDITQRRMYITQNVSGGGDMPFNSFDLEDTDLKKVLKDDGSIDLDGSNKKEIDFTFELPVPDIDNGEIVYSFWTTTGKGDFRDSGKRAALGVGTITVTVGNGTNPAAKVRSFTEEKLFAPDVNGNTATFFSLLNEEVYKINVGREFRNFWDFGYYFGAAGVSKDDNASFASTANYDVAFGFPVEGLKPAADEENAATETLNEMFFAMSTLDADGFDGVVLSGDLDTIVKSDVQKITNLVVGDVIEFVDNYGKKGLIKVTNIEAGTGNLDFIEIDVKVQP